MRKFLRRVDVCPGVLFTLGVAFTAPWADAANVISVAATGGGTYTIDQGAGTVTLETPGTFSITANDTNEGESDYDGYVNAVLLDAEATNGTYNIRIASSAGGNNWTTGARNVGYVDVNSGSKRGNLGMVVIDGRWGVKWNGSAFVDVNPSTEKTRIFQANSIGSDSMARFVVAQGPDDVDGRVTAGTLIEVDGGSTSLGWSINTETARDFLGKLHALGSTFVQASFTIGGDFASGAEIHSNESITGTFSFGGDFAGSMIANLDGNSTSSSSGQFNAHVTVVGGFTGSILAKTRSGAGGEIRNKIDIRADFSGSIVAESSSALSSPAWVRINSDAMLPGTWESGGVVTVGGTTYSTPATYNAARVYWVSHLRGEMNGDRFVNNFDIDPFTQALADPNDYDAAYPWLVETRVYHRDTGPLTGGVCTPDGAFNNFDIDCFTAILAG
ncbi:MAG: hypothetical protein AB7Q17_07700 [Phycisphaerae bacterium]